MSVQLLTNSLSKLPSTVFRGLVLFWICPNFRNCRFSGSASCSQLSAVSSLALFPDTLPLLFITPLSQCFYYPFCEKDSDICVSLALSSNTKCTLPTST